MVLATNAGVAALNLHPANPRTRPVNCRSFIVSSLFVVTVALLIPLESPSANRAEASAKRKSRPLAICPGSFVGNVLSVLQRPQDPQGAHNVAEAW